MGRFVRHLLLILALVMPTLLPPAAPSLAAEGKAPDGPAFVKMPPISFSVIGVDNRIQKEIQILINLEMMPGKLEADLGPFKRRLQDSYLVSMSDLWDARPVDGPEVSGEEIKAKLLKITTDVAGPGIVKSVLLLGIGERSHVR
jgi:hypothetical protein